MSSLYCSPRALPLRLPTSGMLLLLPLMLGACRSFLGGDESCPADFAYRFMPSAAVLSVGQSITAQAEGRACGGRDRVVLSDLRWRTSDSTVVRVDSLTGRVTGRGVGSARILVGQARRSDSSPPAVSESRIGEIPITVR